MSNLGKALAQAAALCILLSSCGHAAVSTKKLAQRILDRYPEQLSILCDHKPCLLTVFSAVIEKSLYVVYSTPDRDKVVVFDLGREPDLNRPDATNIGFGDLQSDGNWRLIHDTGLGSDYELNGGVGTLQEMDRAIITALKSKPVATFRR
jgi:hypothetical protein